jgi:integrase
MSELKKPPKPLTHSFCESVKGDSILKKYADGHGLYFYVTPDGRKSWRFYYRFGGKQKTVSFGIFRNVSLKQAREKRAEAKDLLYAGVDLVVYRQDEKKRAITEQTNTFEQIAREWHRRLERKVTPVYWETQLRVFEKNVFPVFGNRHITLIQPRDILDLVRTIEARGACSIATKVLQLCRKVFYEAMVSQKCEKDPTYALRDVLEPPQTKHFKSLSPDEFPAFLKTLRAYEKTASTFARCAVRLLMLSLLRTSELMKARWEEIDLKAHQWRIPADRMKMNREHTVPLSRQMVEIFQELWTLRKPDNPYVFYAQKKSNVPHMSISTVREALEKMGYGSRMTGHGFRSLAMGCLVEKLECDANVVHLQLSHKKQGIEAAYNRAQFLPQRAQMMQSWADYIDTLGE